jgi:4-amino-4-deoxy-L-arabinose transferase-like glycosyltransferase
MKNTGPLTKSKSDFAVYSLLAGVFILRMIYVSTMGLAPDEAYYWDWSRNPAAGYFDHPPMVAWLIYLSTRLFGATLLGVKFMVVACSFVATLFIYFLAGKYVNKTSAFIILFLLANFTVLFGIGGLVATPDIPMVMFWAIGLFAAYNLFFENSRWSWILLGAAMGCGLLSKYIFGLFIMSVLLFLVCSKAHRSFLFSKRLFGAFLISFVIFLPNIYWNSHHEWVSIMFQFNHGLGGKAFPRFDLLLEYIGGQIGILSIFPFILLVMAVINIFRLNENKIKNFYLLIFSAVPFLFFGFSSLKKHVEPNWPCGAYISGLLLIAILWEYAYNKKKNRLKQFILFSTVITCLTTIIILVHIQCPFLPLPSVNDPAYQIRGRKQWAQDIDAVRKTIDLTKTLPVCTKNYQDAALLAFYLPDHPKVVALNFTGRLNQYSLPEIKSGVPGKKVLVIVRTPKPEFLNCLDSIGNSTPVFLSINSKTKKQYEVFTAIVPE